MAAQVKFLAKESWGFSKNVVLIAGPAQATTHTTDTQPSGARCTVAQVKFLAKESWGFSRNVVLIASTTHNPYRSLNPTPNPPSSPHIPKQTPNRASWRLRSSFLQKNHGDSAKNVVLIAAKRGTQTTTKTQQRMYTHGPRGSGQVSCKRIMGIQQITVSSLPMQAAHTHPTLGGVRLGYAQAPQPQKAAHAHPF